MLDRVAVFSASPVATFLTLLLELLLSLGVSEAEEQLHAIMFVENGMKLSNNSFCNVAILEPGRVSKMKKDEGHEVPGKADLFTDTRGSITADFRGDGVIW